MTEGRLLQVANHYRALLRAREKHDEREIERAYAYILLLLQPALDSLYRQMSEATTNGKPIPVTWLYEAGRLANIKRIIQTEIDQFATLSQMQVQQAQQYTAQLGQEAALEMLNVSLPVRKHRSAVTAHPMGMTLNGIPLAYLFIVFGREAAEEAGKALVTGITLSRDLREIVRDMQNALGIARNRALTISRDQIYNAYRRALLEVYKANSEAVEGWIWSAIRDTHTCIVCILMDGTFHALSEPFEGHVGDRCTPIPKIRGAIPEQVQPGADWFTQQSTDVQRKILGGAKYAAYLAGAITLQDLVRHGYDPRWGGYRQEKSLKEAIGARRAAHYYGK